MLSSVASSCRAFFQHDDNSPLDYLLDLPSFPDENTKQLYLHGTYNFTTKLLMLFTLAELTSVTFNKEKVWPLNEKSSLSFVS